MTTADQTHPLMDATSVLNLDTLAEMLGDSRSDHNAAVAEALPPYLAVLTHGDEIRIGKFRLVFIAPAAGQ